MSRGRLRHRNALWEDAVVGLGKEVIYAIKIYWKEEIRKVVTNFQIQYFYVVGFVDAIFDQTYHSCDNMLPTGSVWW